MVIAHETSGRCCRYTRTITATFGAYDIFKTYCTVHDSLTNTPTQNTDSNLPKIGGSFGGFIALVVCLATIVVFACIAIFILLYKFKPDPYERQYRQTTFGKRESSIYEVPLGPHGMRAKFKNLIGLGKKREGWVRANDGSEEWDASDRNLVPRQVPRTVDHMDAPFSPPQHHASSLRRSSTSESIELSVPSNGQPAPGSAATPTSTYTDPFSSPPLASNPFNTTDPSLAPRGSVFAVQSGDDGSIRSMKKFNGGTKFREALDLQ